MSLMVISRNCFKQIVPSRNGRTNKLWATIWTRHNYELSCLKKRKKLKLDNVFIFPGEVFKPLTFKKTFAHKKTPYRSFFRDIFSL